jgi:hypothetical protein
MANYFWKLWLRPNLLTLDADNDYIAEVSTIGNTLRNEDIARLIGAEGSEIKYDTLLSILNQSDRIKREKLVEGSSVLDGVCHCTPRVLGNWIGSAAKPDPATHRATINAVPSAEMRKSLEQVGFEILGVKDSGARIGLVTDLSTGKTNGSVTANEDILIEGEKIKIAPEDETGLGVFFTPDNASPIPVSHRLSRNDPKHIIARVPNSLIKGKDYRLEIVTRYTGGHTLLKEARTLVYETKLHLGDEQG